MKSGTLLVLLVRTGISQTSLRASLCALNKFSDCNAAKACKWCTAVAPAASGRCYRKSFAERLPSGIFQCAASIRDQDADVATDLVTGRRALTAATAGLVASNAFGFAAAAAGGKLSVKEKLKKLEKETKAGDAVPATTPAPRALYEIDIATFDGVAEETTWTWAPTNDAMLGGASRGTSSVEDGVLILDGNVSIMPAFGLGFVLFRVINSGLTKRELPDIRECEGISLVARSTEPYTGYTISFGEGKNQYGNTVGFKSGFDAPLTEFRTIQIPFARFTNSIDQKTGIPITTCGTSPNNCPDLTTLQNMGVVAIWAERVEGRFHLEVKKISAYNCSAPGEAAVSSLPGYAPLPFVGVAALSVGGTWDVRQFACNFGVYASFVGLLVCIRGRLFQRRLEPATTALLG